MIKTRHRSALAAGILLLSASLGLACDRSNKAETPKVTAAETAEAASKLDGMLTAAWSKAGVKAAPAADDATFMRRAYLDLTGVVPTAAQARAFLTDDRADKRARLVNDLIASDGYAKHWTNYWNDVLLEGGRRQLVDRVAFRQWLHGQLKKNVPYDEMVRRLITAEGVNSAGGRPDLSAWELEEPMPKGVNGAVNYMITGAQEPQNIAGRTARVFLGQQIQCAQCHDHPTEAWKQEDFQSFTSAFMRVRGKRVDRGRVMGYRRFEIEDAKTVTRPMKRRMKKTGYGDKPPRALDGTSLEGSKPRHELARWMTDQDNPWFARTIVNRMWSYFLGRGFVEPVDDLSTTNPPLAPEILDALTADFVSSGYDLQQLMRTIVMSTAYQRAPRGKAELWSSFALRPMNDTQLLDSLVVATGVGPIIEEVAGDKLPRIKINLRKQFQYAFDVDESASGDTFTGTTPQALMLLNGALTSAGSSALEGSTLGQAARKKGGTPATIEHLYLATLGRKPAPDELTHWQSYVDDASEHYDGSRRRARGGGAVGKVYRKKRLRDLKPEDVAYEDVLWSLLNSSEFFFIH